MGRRIRVSDEYHELIREHKRDDETMEETPRRMTGAPGPRVLAGALSDESAETMKEGIEDLRGRDRDRLRRVREAFGDDACED